VLFPPNCSCQDPCKCSEWREKIVLALNTGLYNEFLKFADPDCLWAMKALWCIPEDHLFRELYAEAYPVWLVDKELKNREEDSHFKMIDQLVWTYLSLGETANSSGEAPKVSQNKAIKIILGETPLNKKVSKFQKDEHICGGEKEYASNFNKYKFVCHFIVALEAWKTALSNWEWVISSLYPPPEDIEALLKSAHWFRKKLLSLERHNVKGNIFLSEEDICPLPSWVHSYELDGPIEFSEEELQKIKTQDLLH
jgi:hypothetical protein